ncbi:hypothetical protein G3N55_08885 [Dissulfurirhabdus thermomarina]|uniref:Uncharacterized protein n=1 Tax=Dissulfurirhabdus thermomarina TaxID=1765737 RepID=A0A6N9TNX2_DISTH|nr:hypothetical protein [Dissulfurirhabdus thermomarina]NDY42955.1 hypothetical protein [Dissulfurirhabdus thermomarina]NMX24331.1 hypothetical protein [Dissulfurirhabdus thermomarina]
MTVHPPGPHREGWRDRLERFKPGACRRTHLMVSGLVWAVVGAVMLARGAAWLRPWGDLTRGLVLVGALAAGAAKARWVLDGVAGRIAARIERRGDGRCLGGFLSLSNWALVALMILFGRGLRAVGVPAAPAGCLYIAVGFGLLVSSRVVWRAWAGSAAPG